MKIQIKKARNIHYEINELQMVKNTVMSISYRNKELLIPSPSFRVYRFIFSPSSPLIAWCFVLAWHSGQPPLTTHLVQASHT